MRQLKITKSITNRESSSLEKYLQEIGREELITADEEVRLAKKIKEGDQNALDRLVKANLRFVVSVAKQYQNQGLSLPDLINEGNLGLIKAAKRFDESRGFKFISYAVWWIRQSILQSLAEQSKIVRLPLNQVGTLNKISRAHVRLEQEFEREPTDEELSKKLEISVDKVTSAKSNIMKKVSFDAPFTEGEESGGLYDVTENPNSPSTDHFLMSESLKKEIQRSLGTLYQREQEVVRLYFGLDPDSLPLTLEEIGERLDLTRERVRQIKEKAIRRLKQPSRSRLLKQYL